jgi:4-hydroxy-tetrahydrodipicolinate reductase
MNIALFGYGKMGKEIEAFAIESGHQISARVDSSNSKESFDYSNIDVIIEFSKPEFAAENIRFAIDNSIPIAIGTTGWYDELEDLTTYCNANEGCMLHATNFSLGVNAFFAVNRYLAKIMNELNDYKAEVVEIHHTEKLDAPSGTGISLAEQIIEEHQHYNSWENNKASALQNKDALAIESQRLPKVPGTHEIKYTSEIDSIEIKHTAHNRKGFAQGSVLAAEWLLGKKGVFTMQDILKF